MTIQDGTGGPLQVSCIALYTPLETEVVPLIGAALTTAHWLLTRPDRETISSQAAGSGSDLEEEEPFLKWHVADLPLILYPGKASSNGHVLQTTRYNSV